MITTANRGALATWARGWRAVLFLALEVVRAPFSLVLLIFVLTGIAAMPAAFLGLILLLPALAASWWLAGLDRSRIAALLDVEIPQPVRPEVVTWRRLWGERPVWLSVAWTLVSLVWGGVIGAVVVLVLAAALLLSLWPLYAGRLPGSGMQILGVQLTGTTEQALGCVFGIVLLVLMPLVALALSQISVMLADRLIGRSTSSQVAELSARVETLDRTRAEAVDSVEGERRRIERDLHDGPQQRLVALAMDLGMARDLMERDPQAARELLESAHTGSKEAITEMRQVARGIVPPVLADRGLDAALSALAERAPVPVTVRTRLASRPDPAIEAIAYFVVSEALTNVAKHAQARSATVDVVAEDHATAPPRILVTITDDGVGGADSRGGTGLTGLRQRVAAVDGELIVDSPAGGPTTQQARLPWRIHVRDR